MQQEQFIIHQEKKNKLYTKSLFSLDSGETASSVFVYHPTEETMYLYIFINGDIIYLIWSYPRKEYMIHMKLHTWGNLVHLGDQEMAL